MKTKIVANVLPISIAPTPSLLHHNNVGVTYVGTSNFRMEPIRSIPLYYVAMLLSIIIVTKAPFVFAQVHNIVGIRSRP
jgi:hypothetical protein